MSLQNKDDNFINSSSATLNSAASLKLKGIGPRSLTLIRSHIEELIKSEEEEKKEQNTVEISEEHATFAELLFVNIDTENV